MTQLEQNFFEVATRYFRDKEIDWEQRRYEIAESVVIAFLSNPDSVFRRLTRKEIVENAIDYADALIEELKK